MAEFVFPFSCIDNDEDLLSSILNVSHKYYSFQAVFDSSPLDPFNNNNISAPANWHPNLCKYDATKDIELEYPNNGNIVIRQLNTRSLKQNFDPFKNYLTSFKSLPHIITVSETWLKLMMKNIILYLDIDLFLFLVRTS